MTDTTITPNSDTTPEPGSEPAKSHFAKAIDEAKAGAKALGQEAQDRAGTYREKAHDKGNDWANQARAKGDEAKVRATELANEGKASASKAISGLSKMVEDNAGLIDEKVGAKYGDYARTAAKSMQDAATKLDEKELAELGEDAREFVRKSPGLAVGMAAVAGFMVARLFKGSKD
ncbi:MAG: hypothetical protein KDE55_14340 [Novosphingobium sp.]|nr:hypothetical protein [Novosphingobium sp.]